MAIGLPAKYSEKRFHHSTNDEVKKRAVTALEFLDFSKLTKNKEFLDYKSKSVGLMTLGERIRIYIGQNEILVKSECLNLAQFLDFGKNKKNVKDFFNAFENISKLQETKNTRDSL